MKLVELTWEASEDAYRAYGIHYSAITDFLEKGFRTDWTKVIEESSALRIGSAVDTVLTNGGWAEFNAQFATVSYIVDENTTALKNAILEKRFTNMLDFLNEIKYCASFKDDTRIKRFEEKYGADIVEKIEESASKTCLSVDEMNVITKCVAVLREKYWFFQESELDNSIELLFQPKFKITRNNVNYAIMFDFVIVDHEAKEIFPMDLKTCSCEDWNFPNNFKKYHYDVQARLYSRILKELIAGTDLERYTINPFVFVECSKKTFHPLTFSFKDNLKEGTITYPNGYVSEDPFVLGERLNRYMETSAQIPDELQEDAANELTDIL